MLNKKYEKRELELLDKEFLDGYLDYWKSWNNYIIHVMKLHKKYNLKKIKNRKEVKEKNE